MSSPPTTKATLVKSFPLVLAALVPQLVAAVAVLLTQARMPEGTAALISVMGTVVSLAMVSSVGVIICTLRDLVIATKRGTDRGAALDANAAYAATFALASVPIAALVLALFALGGIVSADLVWVLAATQIPLLLATPYSSVLNGAFQALDRSSENLYAAVLQGAIALGGAVVAFTMPVDVVIALLIYGGVQSVGAVLILWWRAARLRRITGMRLWMGLRADRGGVWDRVSAAIDAVIFITIFLLAQLAAAAIAPDVADQVAIAVAFARTLVVPLKQVGITAGRLELAAGTRTPSQQLATLAGASSPYVLVGVGLAIGYGLWAGAEWLPLVVVIAAQFVIEPFAGVLYSFTKVRVGPRAGLVGLFVIYVGLVPLALLALTFAQASAAGIWLALFLARLCFAVWNVRVLVTNAQPSPIGR